MNEPFFWYTLGHGFGTFDNKLQTMKMTFLHNFGVLSYYVRLCAYMQQTLLKQLEDQLTGLVIKEYKTSVLPGYPNVLVKDLFKINRPIQNDTTELSAITSPRKIPKSYKEIFNDSIYFMKSYIKTINKLFYKNKNKTVNQIIMGLDKLSQAIKNKRIYDDYSIVF